MVLGLTLHYIIKQFDLFIDRRQTDLLDKKPGAAAEELPKLIWVRMLKRPSNTGVSIFELRNKFNSILEEHLLDGRAEDHHIMSIEVNLTEYDLQGNLTSIGKELFWKEVDRAMRKFDRKQIPLHPRKYVPAELKNNTVDDEAKIEIKSVVKKKLPTPPLRQKKHDSSHYEEDLSRKPRKYKRRHTPNSYERDHKVA